MYGKLRYLLMSKINTAKFINRGFEHRFNADLLGNEIFDQHKGSVGAFMSYKDIIFKP